MDQTLIDLTSDGAAGRPPKPGEQIETKITFVDVETGIVEVETPKESVRHTLKPLAELYGPGIGKATVDPMDDDFTQLFLTIEEGIIRHFRSVRRLTDANVLLALKQLSMNPEAQGNGDGLIKHLQLDLRLLLSLSNYSRQEVRMALRRIARSVERHTREAGPMGYLDFICKQLRM